MVSPEMIRHLYEEIDKWVMELLKKEIYWRRCHPCRNMGECCKESATRIFASEWVDISRYLEQIQEADWRVLTDNLYHGRECPFRSELKCLIHDVRPLICRLTPYFAFLKDDTLHYSYPIGRCLTRLKFQLKNISQQLNPDSTLILLPVDLYENEKFALYCLGNKLEQYPTYHELRKEIFLSPQQWMKMNGLISDNHKPRVCHE